MVTRAQKRQAAIRLLTEVIGFDEDAGIVLALEEHFAGMLDIGSLLTVTLETLESLKYPNPHADGDDEPATLPVPRGHCSLVIILQHYRRYRKDIGQPLDFDSWANVTSDDFDDFRCDDYMQQVTQKSPAAVMLARGTTTAPSRSPADTFSSSVKRDPSAYPTLLKDSAYDHWIIEFSAVGRSHGLGNLFNPSFIPGGTEAIDLFKVQQNFLYAVLCTKLKTNTGKDLIRSHKEDAQAILRELESYHHKSTIDSGDLLEYITTARLGAGSTWNGTTMDFILHWIPLSTYMIHIRRSC